MDHAPSIADLTHDPYPHLHRLRHHEPVAWLPALECWLITRRNLAVQVMRDSTTFTVNHPGFSTARVVGTSMLSQDGAEHRRHRQPFEDPYRRAVVERRFGAVVSQEAQALIEPLRRQGDAELLTDFAGPLAVRIMMVALGMEQLPISTVRSWYDALVESVTAVTDGRVVDAAGREAFSALRMHLLNQLSNTAENDLAQAARSGNLDREELVSNGAVLLFGGIETTEGMLANLLSHLLCEPELLGMLRAQPHRIPQAVDESLRLEPAAAVVDRYATQDVELGGAKIKTGNLVRVSLTAANRDPSVFPDPDRFNLARTNVRSHVTFAHGPHVCLGLHLARLEGEVMLETLLAYSEGLRLRESEVAQRDARPRGLVFRKPAALSVVWG